MTVNIDGTGVSTVTIDGQEVEQITVDGDVVYSAVTIVDDFESGSLDSSYSGDTGVFTVTTNNAIEGTYRLEQTTDSYSQIQSTSGLNAYPQQGDEFRVWLRTGSHSVSAPYTIAFFGMQDSNNYYFVRLHENDGDFEVESESTVIDTANQSYTTNTWYEIRVRWDDGLTFGGSAGDITVDLYDDTGTNLNTISGNDTSYTSGGIGWGGSDVDSGFDYNRITNR